MRPNYKSGPLGDKKRNLVRAQINSKKAAMNDSFSKVHKGGVVRAGNVGAKGAVKGQLKNKVDAKTAYAHTGAWHKQMYANGGPTLKNVLSQLRNSRHSLKSDAVKSANVPESVTSGEQSKIGDLKAQRDTLLAKRKRLLSKYVPTRGASVSANTSGGVKAPNKYRGKKSTNPNQPTY